MAEGAKDFDVIIIGAGPAGLSAAIWCRNLGLEAVVLEKEREPGGQLLSIYNPITNYPGLRARDGRELRDLFLETASQYGVDIRLATEVVKLDPDGPSVETADGTRLTSRSIIFATGVRRRRLNIPGEAEFIGRGIMESGVRDKELARGKTVAIIGGGDAALENAVILSEYADKVYVIHRGSGFSARSEFVDPAAAARNVEFMLDSIAVGITGRELVSSVQLVERRTGNKRDLPVDLVLVRIGVEPASLLLRDKADVDQAGYVRVTQACRSSAGRVFAIGDVASPTAPTIAAAVGAGSAAAKLIKAGLSSERLSADRKFE